METIPQSKQSKMAMIFMVDFEIIFNNIGRLLYNLNQELVNITKIGIFLAFYDMVKLLYLIL